MTNLIPNLKEVDPDVAYSSVPYEKGSALLLHLEQLLGGPGINKETLLSKCFSFSHDITLLLLAETLYLLLDIFIGFLRAYIQQFAYKSIMTDDWKNFLYSYFKEKVECYSCRLRFCGYNWMKIKHWLKGRKNMKCPVSVRPVALLAHYCIWTHRSYSRMVGGFSAFLIHFFQLVILWDRTLGIMKHRRKSFYIGP